MAVGGGQLGQQGVDVVVRAGDQFEQRFRIVGGDVCVGQRGAKPGRVRRAGQDALLVDCLLYTSKPAS